MKSRTPLKSQQGKKSNKNLNNTARQMNLRQLSMQRSSKGFNNTSKNEGYLNLHQQQKRMQRTKSVNILKILDQRDKSHLHKYKDFKSHSKKSNFEEIKLIIEELLNKHANQRSISLSEQYILTGYLVMYLQNTKNFNRTPKNPFSLRQRIETKNSIVNNHFLDPLNIPLSPRKLNSSVSSRKILQKNSTINEKKQSMAKQFERLKLLWQMFQLKQIVCPDISKISGYNQTDAHKEMAQFMGKLKNIERNKAKIGEEKSLSQVQKIMRNFQENIKRSFC